VLFSADRQVSRETNFLGGMRFSPVSNPSKTHPCPACKGEANFGFLHQVLQTFSAEVFLCPHCDYLFVAQPHWLEEAYRRVINILDTGCLARTESMRKQTSLPIYLLSGNKGAWLDYGGGHGGYARRMRDTGFDFRWQDPKAENLFAGGFEDKHDTTYEGVTCFECLEHFLDPVAEIRRMLARAPRILFTTELRPERLPSPDCWWYYGWEHGQHVGFHSHRSLSCLAEAHGLMLVSAGKSLHAFLPPGEADSLGARLIRHGHLPLHMWAASGLRTLLSPKSFLRSLIRRRITSKDLVDSIEKLLGSKTWLDHVLLKKSVSSGNF
jgi:hypothetical protein